MSGGKLLRGIAILIVAAVGGTVGQEVTISNGNIKVASFEPLDYPAVADTAHVQGAVVVKVQLDDHGKVVGATVISGPDLLTEASMQNARKWQFEPNPKHAAVIVYLFRIKGVCHENTYSSQFIFEPPNLATITSCGMTVQE